MLSSKIALVSFLASLTVAQNITVNSTDPSIQYEGKATDALICKTGENGSVLGGQQGCYLVPENCTQTVSVSQSDPAAAASLKFKGTAIYVNSVHYKYSPLYSVTLDGESTDVDGVKGYLGRGFSCPGPMFSKTGLDPNMEHEIRLSVKATSPSANESEIENPGEYSGTWSFVSFVYTPTEGASANSLPSSSGSPTGSTAPSQPTNSAENIQVEWFKYVMLSMILGIMV